jgi:hypothetical protein
MIRLYHLSYRSHDGFVIISLSSLAVLKCVFRDIANMNGNLLIVMMSIAIFMLLLYVSGHLLPG